LYSNNESTQSQLYDNKYASGYRSELSGYEIAREQAIFHFVKKVMSVPNPQRILDYGAGRGLHVPLWHRIFPTVELCMCDISSVARQSCVEHYNDLSEHYKLIVGNRADFPDSSFDIIVSVEVMEHVADISAYLSDVFRLLRPGGMFIFTTPCANVCSIEHIYALLTGKIDQTEEGYRRWRWEDPTHLRRLQSSEMQHHLFLAGFHRTVLRFRSHLFSFLCTYLPPKNRFMRIRNWLMTLDYTLFRRLPNGASILCAAEKSR
jgi:ubiquinone/menaquinone biosynthesis C-methylase UbiE